MFPGSPVPLRVTSIVDGENGCESTLWAWRSGGGGGHVACQTVLQETAICVPSQACNWYLPFINHNRTGCHAQILYCGKQEFKKTLVLDIKRCCHWKHNLCLADLSNTDLSSHMVVPGRRLRRCQQCLFFSIFRSLSHLCFFSFCVGWHSNDPHLWQRQWRKSFSQYGTFKNCLHDQTVS